MVEYRSEGNKLFATFVVWAVVNLLFVHRRIDMFVQVVNSPEISVAKVAFPVLTIEG
jgi:hypothetical protein